jgi:hypothetical protein
MATIDFDKPDASTSAADVLEDVRDSILGLSDWLDPANNSLSNAPTYAKTLSAVSIASFGTMNTLENQGNVYFQANSGGKGLHIYGNASSDGGELLLSAQRDISADTNRSAFCVDAFDGSIREILGNQDFIIKSADYATNTNKAIRLEGNTLDIYTGADKTATASAVHVDSSGNVGIGTSSPSFGKLQVEAAEGVNNFLSLRSTGTGNRMLSTWVDDTNSTINLDSRYTSGGAYDFRFRAGATELMRIDASGNVGIGTTSPVRLFDLYKSTSDEVFIHFGNTTTGGTSSDGAHVGIDNNEDLQISQLESGKLIEFWNSGTQALVIDSSGNVGIGTASPTSSNGGLDIASGGKSLIIGADSSASTRTDATSKYAVIGSPHYTNAEEPFGMLGALSSATDNTLLIGSGVGVTTNLSTKIKFYCGATTTTTASSASVEIHPGGYLFLNHATAHLEFIDTGTAAATESGWVEVEVGGATQYIRTYATK